MHMELKVGEIAWWRRLRPAHETCPKHTAGGDRRGI